VLEVGLRPFCKKNVRNIKENLINGGLRLSTLHFLYFRDFRKQWQIQQPDKPVMSITVSPRHYPAKLGFSGQFHGMLVTLTALVSGLDDVKNIKQ
jgi:hypothetical protein